MCQNLLIHYLVGFRFQTFWQHFSEKLFRDLGADAANDGPTVPIEDHLALKNICLKEVHKDVASATNVWTRYDGIICCR